MEMSGIGIKYEEFITHIKKLLNVLGDINTLREVLSCGGGGAEGEENHE